VCVSICTFVPVKHVKRVPASALHAEMPASTRVGGHIRHRSCRREEQQHTSAYVSIRQHASASTHVGGHHCHIRHRSCRVVSALTYSSNSSI
jgi:hypothetical protein